MRRNEPGQLGVGLGLGVVALIGVALTTSCASQASARDGRLPKLHIGSNPGASVERGTAAIAPAAGAAAAQPYVLAAALPTQPNHAKVWRWESDSPSEADVVRLASALGISAKPQRHPHGWVAASAVGELRVRDSGSGGWSYARADMLKCPPYMIDVDTDLDSDGAVGCAVAAAPSAAPQEGPDDAATRAAAQPVLDALGVTGSQRVEPGGPGVSALTVSPMLGSLPTQGIETRIGVDSGGVRSGSGVIALPAAGPDYPLRTAKAALDDLLNQPRPLIAEYCPMSTPSGPPPLSCGAAQPRQLTSVALGLQSKWDRTPDGSEQILVPAWLFNVEGSTRAMAIVAIDPAYLDDPRDNPRDDPRDVPQPEGGPGAVQGSAGAGASGRLERALR